MKALKILLGLALGCALAAPAMAGNELVGPPIRLWSGNADTLDNATIWFPVRGANRVMLRMYSSRAAVGAYAATDLDSLFSDSIAVFKVLMSDSVSFMARDSAGTRVTYRSGIPKTSAHGNPYPICADSVVLEATSGATAFVNADTLHKLVALASSPINTPLRAPSNGSGVYTYIVPTAPGNIATYGDGSIGVQYMKIVFQALRRLTINDWNDNEAGGAQRVRGLKGFYLEAIPIYKNR